MRQSARQAMKGALISLLNKHLLTKGVIHMRVVDLSDDFETATIMNSPESMCIHIKAEKLIPEEESYEEAEDQKAYNRGTNAAQVEHVRRRRVNGTGDGNAGRAA